MYHVVIAVRATYGLRRIEILTISALDTDVRPNGRVPRIRHEPLVTTAQRLGLPRRVAPQGPGPECLQTANVNVFDRGSVLAIAAHECFNLLLFRAREAVPAWWAPLESRIDTTRTLSHIGRRAGAASPAPPAPSDLYLPRIAGSVARGWPSPNGVLPCGFFPPRHDVVSRQLSSDRPHAMRRSFRPQRSPPAARI